MWIERRSGEIGGYVITAPTVWRRIDAMTAYMMVNCIAGRLGWPHRYGVWHPYRARTKFRSDPT